MITGAGFVEASSGWQRAGLPVLDSLKRGAFGKGPGDMFRLRRSAKMAPMVRLQQRNFAACRGVLTLRFEAHEVSGAIPAGSRAAPAGGTYPPDLSSVRFFGQPRCSCRRNMSPGLSSVRFLRVRPSSILQMEWGGLFFSPHQVPCLVCRLSGTRTRLQAVTEGGGMYFACRSESDSPQG